ncbi:MAG: ATP-binding protein [Gammaproteobacteria bacterium]|jgi:ATP-dependent DNA helicase RecG
MQNMKNILHDIKKLILQGESEILEFKKSTAQLKPIFATLCGFLNNNGGTVVIGVSSSGKIIGQDITDNTKQEIAQHIAKIEPAAQFEISYVKTPTNKQLIMIRSPKGIHCPYVYDARAYQRNQSSTSRMSQHRYEQLLVERGQLNYAWDDQTALNCSIEDLNKEKILAAIHHGIIKKRLPASTIKKELGDILEQLHLLENGVLKNAAMVLFGKDTLNRYLQCELRMARFKDTTRHEFLDSDIVYGNLFYLLDEGELFAKRHISVAAKITAESFRRVETPEIPYDVIREALLNALCHRNYAMQGGSVGLAFYSNRIEISNHGGLQTGMTIEQIKQGYSKPRNNRIAFALHKCGYIEHWGRGIEEMIQGCISAGLPEPTFENNPMEFKIIFSLTDQVVEKNKRTINKIEVNLTERQQEIIDVFVAQNGMPLKVKELEVILENRYIPRMLRRDLFALKEKGLVDVKGHTNKAIWFLKNQA